jgi:hypothetical protein
MRTRIEGCMNLAGIMAELARLPTAGCTGTVQLGSLSVQQTFSVGVSSET